MKSLGIIGLAAVIVALRVFVFQRRRQRRKSPEPVTAPSDVVAPNHSDGVTEPFATLVASDSSMREVRLVASREIRERVKSRIFRVGTIIILIIVAAAIVIPTLTKSSGTTHQTVGIVGGLSASTKRVIVSEATRSDDVVSFRTLASLAVADNAVKKNHVDFVIVNSNALLLNEPATESSSPADPTLVAGIAQYLGVLHAYAAAHLTPAQALQIDKASPIPIHTLVHGAQKAAPAGLIIGLVLLFMMLNQYDTWILMGVMQEKANRVVEVLLSAVRPLQLLGGKVLGIGLVALGQAIVIVGFALIVATAVGSSLLHGAAPLVLACQLLWLVLGYAFYCWVFAAAGSMAERQDQVQTLVLPLSVPIIVGYIFSITVASSGSPDIFFKILAYVPATAPFCMPVLVSLSQVSVWGFLASVVISVGATAGTAVFAARIYRRAVLRTGGRVRIRDVVGRGVQ